MNRFRSSSTSTRVNTRCLSRAVFRALKAFFKSELRTPCLANSIHVWLSKERRPLSSSPIPNMNFVCLTNCCAKLYCVSLLSTAYCCGTGAPWVLWARRLAICVMSVSDSSPSRSRVTAASIWLLLSTRLKVRVVGLPASKRSTAKPCKIDLSATKV